MKVCFDTRHYGVIECDDMTKIAWFRKDDLEATINNDGGDFEHPFSSTRFTVLWPTMIPGKSVSAILTVWLPREIARITVY